ncbi:MAG: ATP-binding protein, partial [Planctomycetota bacterium]
MGRLGLLLVLLAPVAAQGRERPEVRLAKQFVEAYQDRDTARQTILAAEPALKVSYALVVDWLLWQGHLTEARALAAARTGPEAAGLKRMVETFADPRTRPTAPQRQAVRWAAELLRREAASQALEAVENAGRPVKGTALAVRITWLRASAHHHLGRAGAAREAFARCADLAHAVGWLAMARDAQANRLRLASDLPEALAAADGYAEASRRLGDAAGLLKALRQRAALHMRAGLAARRQGRPEAAAAALTRAREDYVAAIDLAKAGGERREAALLLRRLAVVWHVHEGQPRRALGFYREALEILRELEDKEGLEGVLLNTAIVLTEVARYGEALRHLDEMLRDAEPPFRDVQRKGLAQRAYVLQRYGRTEQAAAAYRDVLAVLPAGARRVDVLVEAGNLQWHRGDLETAERYFAEALQASPGHAEALVGRARVRGMKGDEAGSRADFDAALAREKHPAARGRWLLIRAVQERSWGRIGDAYRSAQAALELLKDPQLRAYADAGTAWLILGDLLLVRGDYENAVGKRGRGPLARAGTLFFRLKDPYRAIDIYAQETLVLVALRRMEEAVERLQVLLKMAETTPSDSLKSTARAAEA